MNILGFEYIDTVKSLFLSLGYGFIFGLIVGMFRFLLLTFFERESA